MNFPMQNLKGSYLMLNILLLLYFHQITKYEKKLFQILSKDFNTSGERVWLKRRFNLTKDMVNFKDNIVQLAGTREGLFNIALALNPKTKNNITKKTKQSNKPKQRPPKILFGT